MVVGIFVLVYGLVLVYVLCHLLTVLFLGATGGD